MPVCVRICIIILKVAVRRTFTYKKELETSFRVNYLRQNKKKEKEGKKEKKREINNKLLDNYCVAAGIISELIIID